MSAKKVKVLALQSPQIILNALATEFERRTDYQITHLLHPGDMPIHIKLKLDAGERFDAAFIVPSHRHGSIDYGRRSGI